MEDATVFFPVSLAAIAVIASIYLALYYKKAGLHSIPLAIAAILLFAVSAAKINAMDDAALLVSVIGVGSAFAAGMAIIGFALLGIGWALKTGLESIFSTKA